MKFDIRLLYLYLFSFVGLLIVVFGSIRLVDLGLKMFVFKEADKYEFMSPKIEGETVDPVVEQARVEREQVRQRQREFTGAFSMIAVGLPLYAYHWRTIQKERNRVK